MMFLSIFSQKFYYFQYETLVHNSNYTIAIFRYTTLVILHVLFLSKILEVFCYPMILIRYLAFLIPASFLIYFFIIIIIITLFYKQKYAISCYIVRVGIYLLTSQTWRADFTHKCMSHGTCFQQIQVINNGWCVYIYEPYNIFFFVIKKLPNGDNIENHQSLYLSAKLVGGHTKFQSIDKIWVSYGIHPQKMYHKC